MMKAIAGWLLLSLGAGALLVLVAAVCASREERQRKEEERTARARQLLSVGGVIHKRRVRPSPNGGIEVLASCAAEAAEIIAANRGLKIRQASR